MEWDRTIVRKYPSCMVEQNTCAHILFCCHSGKVETLKHTVELAADWLTKAETDPDLLDCIMEFAHGRGEQTMEEICTGLGPQFIKMAKEQDAIGWRRFMEGMICRSMRKIHYNFHHQESTQMNSTCWAQGLIQKLLKATHEQWIYCNIQIHDAVAGTQATLQKEAIQMEIEEQMELGEAGLLEEDNCMMEVNLGDIENTSGEQEEY